MPLSAGDKLGSYTILASIGAGGRGGSRPERETWVRCSTQGASRRDGARSDRLSRFHCEAKALAQLDHHNIVTIHSVEECDGVHFLTMQLVEGLPLDRMIPAAGLPLDRIVEIVSSS
jgi:serine/threonine protein kinase